jgi:hypothetical protein
LRLLATALLLTTLAGGMPVFGQHLPTQPMSFVAVTPSILLAAMPAASPKPVTVFVGPMVRDGFVDADKGVSNSIKDIRNEMLLNRGAFTLVAEESAATLKLYVVWRGMGDGTATITQGYGTAWSGSGQTSGYGVSTSVAVPTTYRLEALLRVGTHEKLFAGESEWTRKRCAKSIVKDLAAWVAANRERLAQIPNAPTASPSNPEDGLVPTKTGGER